MAGPRQAAAAPSKGGPKDNRGQSTSQLLTQLGAQLRQIMDSVQDMHSALLVLEDLFSDIQVYYVGDVRAWEPQLSYEPIRSAAWKPQGITKLESNHDLAQYEGRHDDSPNYLNGGAAGLRIHTAPDRANPPPPLASSSLKEPKNITWQVTTPTITRDYTFRPPVHSPGNLGSSVGALGPYTPHGGVDNSTYQSSLRNIGSDGESRLWKTDTDDVHRRSPASVEALMEKYAHIRQWLEDVKSTVEHTRSHGTAHSEGAWTTAPGASASVGQDEKHDSAGLAQHDQVDSPRQADGTSRKTGAEQRTWKDVSSISFYAMD